MGSEMCIRDSVVIEHKHSDFFNIFEFLKKSRPGNAVPHKPRFVSNDQFKKHSKASSIARLVSKTRSPFPPLFEEGGGASRS